MATLLNPTKEKSFKKMSLKNINIFICILFIVSNFINWYRKNLIGSINRLYYTVMLKNMRNQN